LDHLELPGHKVLRDHRVLLDQQAQRERLVIVEKKEIKVKVDQLAPQALLGHLDNLALMDNQALKEKQD
jgi:hypothetical protein